MKRHLPKVTDTVSSDHHDIVIPLGNANKGADSKLVRIIDTEGYNIGCADKTDKKDLGISRTSKQRKIEYISDQYYYTAVGRYIDAFRSPRDADQLRARVST